MRSPAVGCFLGLSIVCASGCSSNKGEESGPASSAASAAVSGLASAASSAAVSNAPTASASAGDAVADAAPDRPLYYDRPISDADLDGRSLRELSLMRNTIFARAGNMFRRPWLREYFSQQPWYEPQESWDESKISELDRANAKAIGAFEAGLDEKELAARKATLAKKQGEGELSSEDRIEMSLLSQRLGEWLATSDGPRPSPLEDLDRLDEVLTLDDLEEMSKRDLRILRNTVYARRGRPFESKVVQSYFEGAPWYEPSQDYSDALLTEVDRKNIAVIRSVEDSLGGPLHENPEYGSGGWFVMA